MVRTAKLMPAIIVVGRDTVRVLFAENYLHFLAIRSQHIKIIWKSHENEAIPYRHNYRLTDIERVF